MPGPRGLELGNVVLIRYRLHVGRTLGFAEHFGTRDFSRGSRQQPDMLALANAAGISVRMITKLVARGHSVAGCQHGKLLEPAAEETSTKNHECACLQ
jgi:hypothetical protein